MKSKMKKGKINNIGKISLLSIIMLLLFFVFFVYGGPNINAPIYDDAINGANPYHHGVLITWDDVTNVSGNIVYYLYRNLSGGIYDVVSITETQSHEDYDILGNRTYSYSVHATNGSDASFGNFVNITTSNNFYSGKVVIRNLSMYSSNNILIDLNDLNYGNYSPYITAIALTRFNSNNSAINFTRLADASEISTGLILDNSNLIDGAFYNYSINVNFSDGTNQSNKYIGGLPTRVATIEANIAPTILSTNWTFSNQIFYFEVNISDNTSGNKSLNYNFNYPGNPEVSSFERCTLTNSSLPKKYTCSVIINGSLNGAYARGNPYEFSYTISEDDFSNIETAQNSILGNIPDNLPITSTIEIINYTMPASLSDKYLFCNYSYSDIDSDPENISGVQYKWYVDNEGFNNYVELINQTSSSLHWPKFSQNDNVICSVSVNDGFSNGIFLNSSNFTYTENSRPTLLSNIVVTATASSPAQVGDTINFTGTVYDKDVTPTEMINLTFCKDSININPNVGISDYMNFGNNANAAPLLWIFSNSSGLPVDEVDLTVNQVFNSGQNYSSPIYDLYAYEVSNYGDIPTVLEQISLNNYPFTAKALDRVLVGNNFTNRIVLEYNAMVQPSTFLVIKVCVDSNNDGNCDDVTGSSSGEYFSIGVNKTYDSSLNGTAANSSDDAVGPQTWFKPDSIRIINDIGASSVGCDQKALCSDTSTPGSNYSTITCSYTVQESDSTNQTFSAFASDKYFNSIRADSSRTSFTRIGQFYVNHKPIVENLSIGKNVSGNYDFANGVALDNQNLRCMFNITDKDGTTFSNISIYSNYSATHYNISWFYKPIYFSSQDPFVEVASNNYILANVNTVPGDLWYCSVTPSDGFITTSAYNSSLVRIETDVSQGSGLSPYILNMSDNSNFKNQSIFDERNLTISLNWSDADSNNFSVYVCEGHNVSNFASTGCLNRGFYNLSRDAGLIQGKSIILDFLPMGFETLNRQEYNYTVIICDDNFNCNSSNSMDSFFAWPNRQTTSVNVTYMNATGQLVPLINNSANTSQNLYCKFNFTDEEGIVQSTFSYSNQKYFVSWYYKPIFGSDYVLIPGNTPELAHGNTEMGDSWYCSITPASDVGSILESNSSAILIENPLTQGTSPIIINMSDNSKNTSESIYDGRNLSINYSWYDQDSINFSIFVCEGNNISSFNSTGCLGKEFYRLPRGSLPISGTSSVTNYGQLDFLPSEFDTLEGREYNYTVFMCDNSFKCSSGNNATGSFFVINSKKNINVDIGYLNNSSLVPFSNYVANINQNLYCLFNFTVDGNFYSQANLSSINSFTKIKWLKSQDDINYVDTGFNFSNISNSQLVSNDLWMCQISFTGLPISQETNSTPVRIVNTSYATSQSPTINYLTSANSVLSNKANVGVLANVNLRWTDGDSNSTRIYLCNSSDISPSGCLDKTFAYRYSPLSEKNQIINLNFTPSNSDIDSNGQLVVYAKAYDESFSESNVSNITIYVNAMPTANNVQVEQIFGLGTFRYSCNYNYVNNEFNGANDENISLTQYNWWYINGSSAPELVGTDKQYTPISESGQLYCEVKVFDTLGLGDSTYVRSINTVSASSGNYEINVITPPSVTNSLTIIGHLKDGSNNVSISGQVFVNGSLNPYSESTAISYSKPNLFNYFAKVNQTSNVGDSYVYIEKTNSNLINFNNNTLKYIKLYSDLSPEGFRYVQYLFNGTTNDYIILKLINHTLRENVYSNSLVYNYEYENMSGLFNITLGFAPSSNNTFTLNSSDGGYLTYNNAIYYDTIGPTINASVYSPLFNISSNNQLYADGVLQLNIKDDYKINVTSINITMSSSNVTQNFSFEKVGNNYNLLASNLSSGLIASFDSPVINDSNVNISMYLSNSINTDAYILNLSAIDSAGNFYNYTNSFIYDNTTIALTNVSIQDARTSENKIKTGIIGLNWNLSVSDLALLDSFNVSIYKRDFINSSNYSDLLLYSNKTLSTNFTYTISNLVNRSCYYADLSAVSKYGVFSNISQTECLNYSLVTNLLLYLNSSHLGKGILYFNNTINFTLESYNAKNVSYKFVKNSDGTTVNSSFKNTSSTVADWYPISLLRNVSIWDQAQYKLYINATGYNNQTINYTYDVIIDSSNPQINSTSGPGTYNNTDTIVLNAIVFDNGDIRSVHLISNLTSLNNAEVTNRSVITNSTFLNYSILLNKSLLPSNSKVTFNFIATDYADNSVSSAPFNLTFVNRAPRLNSTIPAIYWNKSAIAAEINLAPYFIDDDNDNISYNVTSGSEYVNASLTSGIVYGSFKSALNNSPHVIIKATDINGASVNVTLNITLLTDSCSAYKSVTRLFVGFIENCNGSSDTPPNNGGGSGGSSGGSSGGMPPGISPVSNNDLFVQRLYNIAKDNITLVSANNLYLKEIQFKYTEDLSYGVVQIRKLTGVPNSTQVPTKPVFAYFEVTHLNIDNSKLSDLVMRIQIPKNNTLGLTKNNVVFARWENNFWKEYPVVFYNEDAVNLYFSVRVPGMSYFAILKNQDVSVAVVPTNPVSTTNTSGNTGITNPYTPSNNDVPVLPSVDKPAPVNSFFDDYKIFLFAGLIILFGAIFGGSYLIKKNKSARNAQELASLEQSQKIETPVQNVNPLEDYIKKHLAKRISEDEIRAALIKAGWHNDEITVAIDNLTKKKINMSLIDFDLILKIEALKKKDLTNKDIKEQLLKENISEDKIVTNINYAKAAEKLELQISDWKSQGYTIKQIRQHLIDLNWPTVVIYEVLKKFK